MPEAGVVAAPASGSVLVKRPGANGFVPSTRRRASRWTRRSEPVRQGEDDPAAGAARVCGAPAVSLPVRPVVAASPLG
jgi:hypothetical protein